MVRLAAFVLVALTVLAHVNPAAAAVTEPASVSAAVDEAPTAAPATSVSARIGVGAVVGAIVPFPAPGAEHVSRAPDTTFAPDLRRVARRVRPSSDIPRLADPDPH